MKESLKTPEAFESEMAKFRARHPEWFIGPVPEGKEVNVRLPRPIVTPGSKPWTGTERLDWAEKAAGAGNEDWDGREP